MTSLLVLGNAGLDIGLPIPRMPRPGETLLGGARTMAPGGKGLNQAVAAARAGLVPVSLVAPLGSDAEADTVATALRQEPFAELDLPRLSEATDCSILLVLPDGENCIVTSGACAASFSPEAAARAGAKAGSWLLLQGNLSQAATAAAIGAAHAANVMFNPAPLAWDCRAQLRHCAVVVANAGEAEALTGQTGLDAANALLEAGAGLAIVTLGAAGCAWAGADGTGAFPAPAVHAIDSTGAGDAFCGTLAAYLCAGLAVPRSIAIAQHAAALTVQRAGAYLALPTAAELRHLVAAP